VSEKVLVELRRVLLGIYEEHGLVEAKKKAMEFLAESPKAAKKVNMKDFVGIFRGELAELMLQIHLKEYIRTHKDCFYTKGLTIPRTDGRAGFTEIDLVLYTSSCVYLFECKSYVDEKILIDKCLLVRKRFKPTDIYAQSALHLKNLKGYIDGARKVGLDEGKPYGLIFFSLSTDKLIDEREEEWRIKVPALDEETLFPYLKSNWSKKQIWDVGKLYAIVQDLQKTSDKNFKVHVKNMEEKKKRLGGFFG
jgi:hypothetical protein